MQHFAQRFWEIQVCSNCCQLIYKGKLAGHVDFMNQIPIANISNPAAINYCDLDDLKAVLEVATSIIKP